MTRDRIDISTFLQDQLHARSRHEVHLIAVIDAHLATATRHPAGTTDRLLAADRDRPY